MCFIEANPLGNFFSVDLTGATFTFYETTTAGGIKVDVCTGSCPGLFVPCGSGNCNTMLNRSVLDIDSKYWRKVVIMFDYLVDLKFFIGIVEYYSDTNVPTYGLTSLNTKMIHLCRETCNVVIKDVMIK